MKTTLIKKSGWLLLVFLLQQAFTQTQMALLLPNAPADTVVAINNTNLVKKDASIITLQPVMQEYVKGYLKENAYSLGKLKKRKGDKIKAIQQLFEKSGLPPGLSYMAIVESELENKCTSGAGAVGVWQLMPETAQRLGLKVDSTTDQRRHFYKSSVAAARHLKELYKDLDDWLLVVAAYNCGVGNVYKAIKLSGSRDYWKLQRYLPGETKQHVKRFIAIHYYYEQSGSVATLTKQERLDYFASLVANNQAPIPAVTASIRNSDTMQDFNKQQATEAVIAGAKELKL